MSRSKESKYQQTKRECLKILKEILSVKVHTQETSAGFLFEYGRPVVVKAKIEKSIKEGNLPKGTLIQYEDAVEYRPTGKLDIYDLYYKIRE